MADRKVVITGATGLIGSRLVERLIARGDQPVVFTRDPDGAEETVPGAAAYVNYDGDGEVGPWATHLDGADAVVNLAGEPILQRWTSDTKARIWSSRVDRTRALVRAMSAAEQPPKVLVSGSAVGYYGAHGADQPLTEASPNGTEFLAELCRAWEDEAKIAAARGVRTTLLRTGIVLSAEGGALAQLLIPFKAFVGGPVLPGTQPFSWIHREDLVNLILLALDDVRCEGALNGTAPNPQTNADFSHTLGRALHRPAAVPVPAVALQLLYGDAAETLTTGQWVLPAKAKSLGYTFQFPTSASALADLL